MRVQCKCAHPVQDQLHGPQMRVANATAKSDKDYTDVRCTVCKTIHRVATSKVKK
jgi:hypothetical protein